MVGEPGASIGRPEALDVDASRGALTLPAPLPLVPPKKSHVPPLLQNALLPGPETVKVDSVKEVIATLALAAPALTMTAIAAVAPSNLGEEINFTDASTKKRIP
jgi:hypothetical protein